MLSIEAELWPNEDYIAGIGILDLLCSCDLDLDLVTFIYELDLFSIDIYLICEK